MRDILTRVTHLFQDRKPSRGNIFNPTTLIAEAGLIDNDGSRLLRRGIEDQVRLFIQTFQIDASPKEIAANTILVSRPAFKKWLHKNKYPPYMEAMCRVDGIGIPHMVFSEENLNHPAGKRKVFHELAHVFENCPAGLREPFAEFCASRLHPDKPPSFSLSLKDTPGNLREEIQRQLDIYDLEETVFRTLCATYGENRMLDILFKGAKWQDPPALHQVIENLNGIAHLPSEIKMKRLQELLKELEPSQP